MAVRPRALVRLAFGLWLASATGLVAPIHEAHATTLADLSTDQLTDASTYIVRGTVKRVWTEVDDKQRVWTRAELDVTRVLKGPDRPTKLVIDSLGGFHEGVLVDSGLAARFSPDEEILVFLDSLMGGQRLVPVSEFLGKYTLRLDPDSSRQLAVRYTVPGRQRYDARFIPAPAPAERVYADDLVKSIESRLNVGWDGQPIPGISADKLRLINAPVRRTP